MWFLYVLGHISLLGTVNYIDEYLTGNSKLPESSDIHTKIGGLLLVSTLFCFIGALAVFLVIESVDLSGTALFLALASAIPMVIMFGAYFYLLTLYPAYLVVPLFLTSSFWLLIIELFFGGSVTLMGFAGIVALVIGAYLLDAGTLKWQIPTKLIFISVPLASAWAVALFMVRVASETASPAVITFWQMVGIGAIGIALFLAVKKYREGFLFRIKTQGRNFLGFSFINESLSQGAYLFAALAVAAAPVATYVPALGGLQGLFLLGLFALFPQNKERSRITTLQVVTIVLIALGVFLIERSY